jgi:hypothetical protein
VQKRESCLKEGAGWVERAGGDLVKNVLIRERDRYRERERYA